MTHPTTGPHTVAGALTAAYGLAVTLRPATLLGPAGLDPTPAHRRLARGVGLRDIASGSWMLLAPSHQVGRAVTTRVVADASDVVVFGALCPPRTRLKAVAIAAGWGTLCLLTHPRVLGRRR